MTENATSKDVIADLETNLGRKASESGKKSPQIKKLSKALDKEIENARVLKNVVDTQNLEASKSKHFIDSANKTLKSKEKEIHNLEKKTLSKGLRKTLPKLKMKNQSLKSI